MGSSGGSIRGPVCLCRAPVPEVDGAEKFIYMQYVHGQTLEEASDSLEHHDRDTVCHRLRTICDNLRQLEQDPSGTESL